MKRSRFAVFVFIAAIILISFILMIMELPPGISCLRPNFLALAIFYLCLYFPGKINLFSSWLIGLMFDGVEGFMLGNNALQLLIIAAVTIFLYNQIRFFSIVQHALIIGLLTFTLAIVKLLILVIAGQEIHLLCLLTPALLTVFLWPIYYVILQFIQPEIKL